MKTRKCNYKGFKQMKEFKNVVSEVKQLSNLVIVTCNNEITWEYLKDDGTIDTLEGYEYSYMTVYNKDNKNYYHIYTPYFNTLGSTIEYLIYKKVNARKKIQASYSEPYQSIESLCGNTLTRSLSGVHIQEIFSSELNCIVKGKTVLAHMLGMLGYREKAIYEDLDNIQKMQKDDNCEILRFVAKDGKHFDFETKSMLIKG